MYLCFFAEVSTKLKKWTIFDNFRIITQEGNMKTTQMIPLFHLLFLLFLLVTFISQFENTSNSISNSLLRSILVCKIPQFFSQELLIWTAHHTFPESRHPEVTKNLYYVLFTRWSNIPIFLGSSSWTILEVEENFI